MDFGVHFGSLFDIIQQLLTRHGVRRTLKEQGRSAIAMKHRRNSEEQGRNKANREGTSKAGKGPLKHHEENREGPGQKKRDAQRASRAMREHGRAVRKQGRSWGKHGKTEAAGGRRGR